jgi:hypothetical protein
MPRRSTDLLIVSLAAVMGLAAQLLAMPAGWRVGLGVPLLLFWPGYALTAALFPHWRLGWTERVVFSLSLSLFAAILGAVLLNWTIWRLSPASWAALGGGVTLGACLLAAWRRRGQLLPGVRPLPVIPSGQLALLGLAALLTVGAIGLSRAPAQPADVQGYTMLWLTPETDSQKPQMRVSVRSAELTQQSYRLELTASGMLVAAWPDVSLAPGETWEARVQLGEGPAANSHIEARLYRTEEPGAVYRRVSWWGSQ